MTILPEGTASNVGHLTDQVVLVTGGAGAIGSNLVRTIAEAGCRMVIVLDDMSASYGWNVPSRPNILMVRGSVTDDVVLKRVFAERPDYVFHLAAFFANQNSVDYPELDLEINGSGTLKVLEYANLTGVERVVYTSSGSIYESGSSEPITEDATSFHMTTPYQATKLLGELYADFFHHHHDLPVVNLRLFNNYGPGEVPGQYRNVVPNFFYWALNGRALPITGTGQETRTFTYVGDVVNALLLASTQPGAVGGAFNISSGVETTIGQLAERVNALADNDAGIAFTASRTWDTRKRGGVSTARAREVLGFEATVDLATGLADTAAWFRDNWERLQRDAQFPPGMSSAVRGSPEPADG